MRKEGFAIAKKRIPKVQSSLRRHIVYMPSEIRLCSGILIFGRRIKSLIFTTDIALIRNCNADAVIAVYPFTPQPIISRSILTASEIPVFCGVGGGTTRGSRVVSLAQDAEFQGAMGVVLNAPTDNEILREIRRVVDIPVIITVVRSDADIDARLAAGASILNVSAAARTPEVVGDLRLRYPKVPIIATGGPSADSILQTIDAGANAITYTPPTAAELFRDMMGRYREDAAEEAARDDE